MKFLAGMAVAATVITWFASDLRISIQVVCTIGTVGLLLVAFADGINL